MANEIQMPYTAAGQTLYAVVRDVNAQAWDNTAGAWEAYDTTSLGDYDIPMTQQGTASRYYVATFPATIAAGRYYVTMFLQAGGSPAEGDTLLGHDRVDWDGSAIVGLYTAGGGSSGGSVNVTQIEGADATDAINAACDAAIETYGLDHLLAASVTGTDITDNSIIAKLASKSATADWDSYVNTTDALEAIADAASTFDPVTDTVDGQTYETLFRILLSYLVGTSSVTDNGDGSVTVTWKKKSDASTSHTVTFTKATGAHSATTIS